MKYIAFHKPYGVVSQFTGEGATLGDFSLPKGVYAAGRLDKDSEGLLLLTDDGPFIKRVTDPSSEKNKVYWAQVEGEPKDTDFLQMRQGLVIKGKKTRPCQVSLLKVDTSSIGERNPPIRERKNIPTSWVEVVLQEGMNRQVRRSLAAIGFPCLRLIRMQIGKLELGNLAAGNWRYTCPEDIL